MLILIAFPLQKWFAHSFKLCKEITPQWFLTFKPELQISFHSQTSTMCLSVSAIGSAWNMENVDEQEIVPDSARSC